MGLKCEHDRLKKNLIAAQIKSLDVPVGDEEDVSLYDLIPGNEDVEEVTLNKVHQERL